MGETQNSTNITPLRVTPTIITRDQHNVSRADIADGALKVLYRLKNAGYAAYLVGGGVRDLLAGIKPKDFDVATDARPEQVRELFRNCRLIGRRFRIAHVYFGNELVEVATFRAGHEEDGDRVVESGRILRDNVYGTIDDDVWRRDFTVNALYYNIADFSIVDYVGGVEDVRQRRLRLIGDPRARYREDPVRMLRAVRLATKLEFSIDEPAYKAILEMRSLLEQIPAARLLEETFKMFLGGHALITFRALREHQLLDQLFPDVAKTLDHAPNHERATRLIEQALTNTDTRLAEGKPVTPAFLFAAFFWYPLQTAIEIHESNDMPSAEAMRLAGDSVISRQVARVAIPRRLSRITREIWMMQQRLTRRAGKRAERSLSHPRFRAAYDFLLLRADAGEPVTELADWWTTYQTADGGQRQQMQAELKNSRKTPRRRRSH